MPLSILVPLILVGLPLVIGTVYWMTRDSDQKPLTKEAAQALFARDFPYLKPDQIWISNDEKSALFLSKKTGAAGLLLQMGSSFLTRVLEKDQYEATRSEDGLNLYLHEFTLKQVQFETSEADAILSALKKD